MLISKRHLMGPFRAFLKPMGSLMGPGQRWSPRGRPWPRGRPRGHIFKSLASKPQVLGLKALGPRKLPCPRLEDSTVFESLKFC